MCVFLLLCSESTFGKMSYLQPMDTRQYLYCLKPKPEFAEKAGVIKGVTVIGKLDIVWKTNLGERGRLQTSQLQRMVRSKLPVHMTSKLRVEGWSWFKFNFRILYLSPKGQFMARGLAINSPFVLWHRINNSNMHTHTQTRAYRSCIHVCDS